MMRVLNFRDWRGLLLASLAGAAATLAFSPFDYWPIMPASIALLFLALDNKSLRTAIQRGLFYGLGFYGAGASWVFVSIHQFGGAPTPLAAFLTGLFVLFLSLIFFVPVTAVFNRLSHNRASWQRVLLFAGLWILGEWCRSWFLTGFPWLFAGYTLLDTPMAGLAPITGVYGLSLLLALTGATVGAFLREQTKQLLAIASLIILITAGATVLSGLHWTKPVDTPPVTFGAVQGNISQDLKWQPGHLEKTIQIYLSLSAPLWHKDLLFWPENSIPTFYQNVPDLMDSLEQQAAQFNTSFILGMPWYADGPYYNALIGMGEAEGTYFKQKLVPFGEFVPLESMIRGVIAFFDLPMSSFSAGAADQPDLRVNGHPVASYICYEVVYPDFAARQARGTGFLLTVSNDTWFGTSIGPEQHFQMVRMRSLETGRYQLRVTNDGITALITPLGHVVSTIPRYQGGVLEGKIPVMTGNTPFMSYGSWPVLILCGILVLLSARLRN